MASSWKLLSRGTAGTGREGTGMEVVTRGQLENSPARALPNIVHGLKEMEIAPHFQNKSTEPPQLALILFHPEAGGWDNRGGKTQGK